MSESDPVSEGETSSWRRTAGRLGILLEQLREWLNSIYRPLGIRRIAVDRRQLLLSRLLIDEAIGSILLVTRRHAEIAIDSLCDKLARVLIATLEGGLGQKVPEQVIVRAAGDQPLVAKRHRRMVEDERSVELILRRTHV